MTRRLRAIPAVLLAAALATMGLVAQPAGASTPVPQWSPAQAAARYLAGQLTAQGYIPVAGDPTVPNLSDTAQSVMALSAAGVDPSGARAALGYLAGHVDAYVVVDGADGPGQLAVLILDAEALGLDPRTFAGTNLVTRLLATEQRNDDEAGLFGNESQLDAYDAGTYLQGLALAALAAVGDTTGPAVVSADAWLESQQCPDGGWSLPDAALDPCNGLPANYAGPDTNSTALAVEGLAAQNALGTRGRAAATAFLVGGQDADADWSYYANSASTPAASDPDSTALVVQALVAMGLAPSSFPRGGHDPLSTLLGFQFRSGRDAGAFYFPPAPAPPSNLATYQAVPALLGLALPLRPPGGATWLAGSDGGVFALGGAPFYGSLPASGVHVSDIVALASTPDLRGYLELGADGGVFSFGDAQYRGSLPGLGIHVAGAVGLVPTADGRGYLVVTSNGGVFSFGDARYRGSLPGLGVIRSDVVALVPTADQGGYWIVTADGAVYAFGDAHYAGSLPALGLAVVSVVGLVPSPDGHGYWLIDAQGAVFALGDAAFLGAAPAGAVAGTRVVAAAPSSRGAGYLLATADGGVFAFGDAVFGGSATSAGVDDIVALASAARPAT